MYKNYSIKNIFNITFLISTLLFNYAYAAKPSEYTKDDQAAHPPILTAEMAMKIALAAYQKANTDGKTVTLTVVDRSGQTMVVLRHEKSGVHNLEASYKKAYTANSFKQATHVLKKAVESKRAPAALHYANGNILILDGGLPIRYHGEVIGAIGVGGAVGNKDVVIAEAGLAALE